MRFHSLRGIIFRECHTSALFLCRHYVMVRLFHVSPDTTMIPEWAAAGQDLLVAQFWHLTSSAHEVLSFDCRICCKRVTCSTHTLLVNAPSATLMCPVDAVREIIPRILVHCAVSNAFVL